MTLEETIKAAEQGNLNAIADLADYYFGDEAKQSGHEDIDKAINWYMKGFEFGHAACGHLAANLLFIKGVTVLGPYGLAGEEEAAEAVKILKNAWSLNMDAKKNGFNQGEKLQKNIAGELGIALFTLAPYTNSSEEMLKEALIYLDFSYSEESSVAVKTYLALAIIYTDSIDAYKLAFNICHECVDNHFGELSAIVILAKHLGIMYITGDGGIVNDDKAYFYLKKAHDAGANCSELLAKFKKTLFGKIKFIA